MTPSTRAVLCTSALVPLGLLGWWFWSSSGGPDLPGVLAHDEPGAVGDVTALRESWRPEASPHYRVEDVTVGDGFQVKPIAGADGPNAILAEMPPDSSTTIRGRLILAEGEKPPRFLLAGSSGRDYRGEFKNYGPSEMTVAADGTFEGELGVGWPGLYLIMFATLGGGETREIFYGAVRVRPVEPAE